MTNTEELDSILPAQLLALPLGKKRELLATWKAQLAEDLARTEGQALSEEVRECRRVQRERIRALAEHIFAQELADDLAAQPG